MFVFSEYHAKWLRQNVDCPVESLVHPATTPHIKFNFKRFKTNTEKKIIQIGFWLRKMHAIKHLDAEGYLKIWIIPSDYAQKMRDIEAKSMDIYNEYGLSCVGNYKEISRVENYEYDQLLSENIVFLYLYDSSANNTIVECIVRNTPILVNPLPAVVEYLGEDYPFYFNTLKEAEEKLQDNKLIKETHDYLLNLNKKRFSPEYFLSSLTNSNLYKSFPLLNNSKYNIKKNPNIDVLSDLNIIHGAPLKNDFVFLISYRNQEKKLLRCLKSVVKQCHGKYDAGIILIDDCSDDNSLKIGLEFLKSEGVSLVTVQNKTRKLFTRNLFNGIYHLVIREDSVIIEVDGDDYLEDTDVLGILAKEYANGARKTFGSFRMTKNSNHFPGNEVVNNPDSIIDIQNAWDLDFCFPWMHLKTYKRELFMEVPLEYFWEKNSMNWLKTAEDLSSHPMMMSIAGPEVRFIKDILYVYDFSGKHHELNQINRPQYIIENLYRVPSGKFIGDYWEMVRNSRLKEKLTIDKKEREISIDLYSE